MWVSSSTLETPSLCPRSEAAKIAQGLGLRGPEFRVVNISDFKSPPGSSAHASAFVHPGRVFRSLAGRAWFQFRGVGAGGWREAAGRGVSCLCPAPCVSRALDVFWGAGRCSGSWVCLTPWVGPAGQSFREGLRVPGCVGARAQLFAWACSPLSAIPCSPFPFGFCLQPMARHLSLPFLAHSGQGLAESRLCLNLGAFVQSQYRTSLPCF